MVGLGDNRNNFGRTRREKSLGTIWRGTWLDQKVSHPRRRTFAGTNEK